MIEAEPVQLLPTPSAATPSNGGRVSSSAAADVSARLWSNYGAGEAVHFLRVGTSMTRSLPPDIHLYLASSSRGSAAAYACGSGVLRPQTVLADRELERRERLLARAE
jgi:hypothetical protein